MYGNDNGNGRPRGKRETSNEGLATHIFNNFNVILYLNLGFNIYTFWKIQAGT